MRRFLLLAVLAFAACSDDNNPQPLPDAKTSPDGGTPTPDGPAAATFASEVIDLIENQTADNTPPVAVDFTSADTQDPAAFDSLF